MKNKIVVFLLGLPRSGTTMATAIFDVNPKVGAIFEPWNVENKQDLEPWTCVADIINNAKQKLGVDYSDRKILLIKETAANPGSIDWVARTIKNLKNNNTDVRVVWLLRDPNHVYLSRVRAAREWWGHEQMKVNQDTFRDFVKFALSGFNSIKAIALDNKTLCLSYEYLLKNLSDSLQLSMSFIGTLPHESQLEYEKHFRKFKAAGDINVSKNPKQPDYKMVTDKDEEWAAVKDELLLSLEIGERKTYLKIVSFVERMKHHGPVQNPNFIENLKL